MTARRTFRANGPDTADRDNWRDRAACKDADFEVFFRSGKPGRGLRDTGHEEALEYCARCPVVNECLTFAMESDERYGVYGNTTPQERAAIKGWGYLR